MPAVENPLASGVVPPQLNPAQRTLLGPGPQNAHPRVHAAMSLPQVGHMDPSFLKTMEEVKALLRYVWQTNNEFTVPVSGTGSAAWEAGVANLTEPGDKHLIFNNGYFGERAIDMHGRYTDNVVQVQKPYGEWFSYEEIEAAVLEHKPQLIWIVHAETSTGVEHPMYDGKIGELCRRPDVDCLFMLDTVTSICGLPVELDKWGVDCAYAGTQKCMGVPPGVAPLTIGARGLAKMDARKESSGKVKNWYLDMNMIKKYISATGGGPRVYHHTAPISMVYAIREGLTLVAEEGLEACHTRHRKNAEYFWTELKQMGLECCIPHERRLPSLTTVKIPEDVDGMKVILKMREEYSIEIGGALGAMKGKAWRIGLMGYNNRKEIVSMLVHSLKACIDAVRAEG